MESFFSMEILGAWSIVFFTLCIFSYLLGDNPFYKIAEHIFVGVSAGYIAVYTFWSTIWPNLFGRLWPVESSGQSIWMTIWYGLYDVLSLPSRLINSSIFPKGGIDAGFEFNITYIIPWILGIFMLLRLVPSLSWLARFSIAYIVGMISGLKLYSFLNSNILYQIKDLGIKFNGYCKEGDFSSEYDCCFQNGYSGGLCLDYDKFVCWEGPGDWCVDAGVTPPNPSSFVDLWVPYSSWDIFNQLLIIIGVIAGLIYFFFSMEHKGVIGKVSKVGIFYLMIKFGASFGFAVMGRISLLIGRFEELIQFSDKQYYSATPIIMILIIISLAGWFYLNKAKNKQEEIEV